MPSFKDQVSADIKGVYLNGLEFADLHQIRRYGDDPNVDPVLAVVDKDIIDERKGRGGNDEYAEGVFNDMVLLYVDAEDLSGDPVRDEVFFLDGDQYYVRDTSKNMGIIEITLEASKA